MFTMEPTTTTPLALFSKNKKLHSHSVHKLNGLNHMVGNH